MIRALPHIFARTFNTPLMIHGARLDALVAGLRQASIKAADLFETDDRRERELGDTVERVARGIALVAVHDVLVKRAGQVTADSTVLESYAHLGQVLRNAIADDAVGGILLDIDSAGGEVGGLFDLVSDIRAMTAIKPIWAIANDDALSAAYMLAAATQRIWASRTAALGSIGVVALHCNQCGFDAQEGLVYEYVYAGAHKIDGNPHQPLGSDARTQLQAEVDRLHGMLIDHVAEGRGLDRDTVRATEAQVFYGERAVEAGLADDLGTIDDALGAMHAALAPPEPDSERTTMAPEEPGRVVQLDAVRAAGVNIRRDVAEIIKLCEVAWPSNPAMAMQLATQFIGRATPLAAVRAELLRHRAEADQQHQIVPIDTSQIGRRDAAGSGLRTDSEFIRISNERWAAQMGRAKKEG
jgi:capsid assembly protease